MDRATNNRNVEQELLYQITLEIVHGFIVFGASTKKTCCHNQYFGICVAQAYAEDLFVVVKQICNNKRLLFTNPLFLFALIFAILGTEFEYLICERKGTHAAVSL